MRPGRKTSVGTPRHALDHEPEDSAGTNYLSASMIRPVEAWLINREHDSTPFYMDGSAKAAVGLKTRS
ncbi:MAG: hypothetical protein QOJ20_2420 [Mycobacterium sp.]|jgi:hypothetical protein|nr:hypothetical protein [Mycobacterium sp.]MDT5281225.1 hypothetical protein [Mycobacterium sp.]